MYTLLQQFGGFDSVWMPMVATSNTYIEIQNSRTSLISILLLYKYSSYDYRVIFFMSKCVYIFWGSFCICYIIILNMFRAVSCSSSGGQILLLQHLVSSLSVNGRTCCTVQRVTIPEAVIIQFVLLKMSIVLLETC